MASRWRDLGDEGCFLRQLYAKHVSCEAFLHHSNSLKSFLIETCHLEKMLGS